MSIFYGFLTHSECLSNSPNPTINPPILNSLFHLNDLFEKVIMTDILSGVFYNVKNESSFITSKRLSKNLSNENKDTMFPENWHFNSGFVFKPTKAPVFVFITEIL